MNTRTLALALIATLAPGSGAIAEVTHAEWTDDDHYHFHVNFMPDLDQDRFTLPGNGSMFCVPTATMNMFAYAAAWGFEDLPPGPGVWQGQVGHFAMTQMLRDLGELMDTGTTGTNRDNWYSGAQTWIDGHPLVRSRYYKTATSCPVLSDAASRARFGSLVAVCYGRYNFNPGPQPVLGSRTGGHCVTAMHMRADGSVEELWVRDPSDGGSIFSEAPWAMKVYDSVETRSVLQDWDNDSAYHPVDATVLQYNPDADQIRLIDLILTIQPATGWSWSTHELNVVPFSGDFQWAQPVIPSFEPLVGYDFAAAQWHPEHHSFITLQTRPGRDAELVSLDRISGDATRIGGYAGATDFVVGRHHELYLLAGRDVHRLALDGAIVATAQLPAVAQAIACRDTTDEVIVVSTTGRIMTVFPRSLGVDGKPVYEYAMNQTIPPTTDPAIAVREEDGAVAILAPEVNLVVYGVRPIARGGGLEYSTFVLPEAGRSLAIDDNDHLVVAAVDSLEVYEFRVGLETQHWWDWEPVLGGPYAGLEADGAFNMLRSRDNYDERINADDDVNIPSEELLDIGTLVLDCPGDLTFDGHVTFADLLAVLAAWGPCDECPEDLDFSGDVGFGDILVVLGNWGPCVPQ